LEKRRKRESELVALELIGECGAEEVLAEAALKLLRDGRHVALHNDRQSQSHQNTK